MIITPTDKPLKGEITVPGDKSISHRALMIGALCDGDTEITGFLPGDDCLSTIRCLRELGVSIEQEADRVVVHGVGLHGLKKPKKMLDAGNSGTTMRLLSGILAAQSFSSSITGDKSLQKRPMGRIIRPIELMGGMLEAEEGRFCPLKIKGQKLTGMTYPLPVASAQLKSCLLLAGLYADSPIVLIEPEKSRDHTELMLRCAGVRLDISGKQVILYPPEKLVACSVDVPGDISSAAFFIVAAAILPGSELRIRHVGLNPTRCGLLDALKEMGADITVENLVEGEEPCGDLLVRYAPLHGTKVGGDIIPRMIDEIPALAVAAAFAKGRTVIKDAAELKIKESNRIDMIENEFQKAGVAILGTEDGLIIEGGKQTTGTIFSPRNDHRMAMACAILALRGKTCSQLLGTKCAEVSFPEFFETLSKITE